jgi:hypothetical protein
MKCLILGQVVRDILFHIHVDFQDSGGGGGVKHTHFLLNRKGAKLN